MYFERYELRLYDTQGRLLSYVPFETREEAEQYFKENEDMCEDWCLYLVRLTPSSDHATFIRRMKRHD